jgi:RNA polymerase sigma factor (sigma-70 family)
MSQANGVVSFIRGAANATDAPDAELVQRFATAGDELAFRALVARYGPMVWAVCRRLVRDHHDAEDAFQAALLVFARKAGDLRTGEAVGGWLHAVAYRVASRVRSTRRAEPSEAEPSDGPPGGALDELTVREAEAALHEELARLPEKYRAPLVLCCLDGLSRDEAAARLGWSANQVKHGLEQGRDLLRSRLARRGIAFGLPLLTGALASPASAVPPALTAIVVLHATGATVPPAAIHSLANGVNRTMWVAKWKWAVVGFAALALTAGGALAAVLRPAPEAPKTAPVPSAEPIFAARVPARAPEPKKEPAKPAWEIATEYLQLIIDGKPEQAEKLGDRPGADAGEVTRAGLKRVKLAMILIADERVLVVTERAKLKRRPNADPTDEHVTVTLERKETSKPWRVIENDVADEKKVLREMKDYPERYNVRPEPKEDEKRDAKAPKANWDVATEFLKLALDDKTADALKLTPGNMTENKIKEIKESGVSSTKVVAVLINDTRIDVVYDRQIVKITRTKSDEVYPVLMLVKSKDGAWQVKDVDLRDPERLEDRVKLYLGGAYDDAPAKK